MKTGFTGLVVAELESRFSVGDKLTHRDFADTAKAHGNTLAAVSHILRHQSASGNIRKLHDQFTKPGANRIRVYVRCEPENFSDTKPEECAVNLQNVIFNWGAK